MYCVTPSMLVSLQMVRMYLYHNTSTLSPRSWIYASV